MAGEIEHDTPGKLDDAHGPQVADGAEQILLEVPEKERTISAFETDLVIVDDGAEAGRAARHQSLSSGRACFGRRRYTVFGTSTFGGFLGMGLRTRA